MSEARQAAPFDVERWKQWEGHLAGEVYPLERCIGGTGRGAVFETQFEGRPAAVKIVPGTPEAIEKRLAAWRDAASLHHPALAGSLARGEGRREDSGYTYFVMDRADENLAEVLADRPLTVDETRDLMAPLLGVLQYLEANRYSHGGLRPSNIMAFGDQLKVSSDTLVRGGDTAADCRAIGVLLEEALGAKGTTPLPEPFAAIVRNCATPDPAARWNLARIESALRGDPPPEPPAKSRAGWWVLAAVGAAATGAIALWPPSPSAPETAVNTPPPAVSTPAPAVEAPPPAKAKPKAEKAVKVPPMSPPAEGAKPAANLRQVSLDGITQVMPDIPAPARRTITGRVRIGVRVRVNSGGSVDQATLEPPSGSKYFSDRVLAATRAWKFPAGNAPQDWVLRFELTRDNTRVSAAKAGN